jgi:hypothetical protein
VLIRSARVAGDGRPTIVGVGARPLGKRVRVDVMEVAESVRAGRVRMHLVNHDETVRVTVALPTGLMPGAYENVTLEVAE